MSDVIVQCYLASLGAMEASGPKNIASRAMFEASELDENSDVGLKAMAEYLSASSLNDPLRKKIHLAVARWDSDESKSKWAAHTTPRSRERRLAIYTALGLDADTGNLFDRLFAQNDEGAIVISDDFESWYTHERQASHSFYWPAYSKYLLDRRGWGADSLAELDAATSRIVERLSDPQRVAAYQTKGLVVGYVQSGKTANFTGVLAKAIDAGYRLIIVLTGTVDILREQTQRRVDMELIGQENILRDLDPLDVEAMAGFEYIDDPDWPKKFISHGGRPSTRNFPDIIRLTNRKFDYKSLKSGIVALEIEKVDKSKPLFAPENLPSSSARIVIVKKNGLVLKKLVNDLKNIKSRLGEIPALIIDDESDQASINTSDPKKWAQGRIERTTINGLLARLLHLLPRAQYVGYTATPFANVFVDPSDAEDIFPKDFLISLDRPPGYMGVNDFHDLDSLLNPEDRTISNSREKAHVRNIFRTQDRSARLQEAVDAFVLSGALKLYRESQEHVAGHFRHHTMLVHESVRTADHDLIAKEVRDVWKAAAYSSPAGLNRLEQLYNEDFKLVCAAQGTDPFPETFDALKSFVSKVVARITENGDPVIIVNGEKDMAKEAVDFDKRSVWRILVGGAKLSRGFTIEGLTISWYRRKTKQADTLMQMGRWFGFRRGYRDLVRLYIGRDELEGTGTVDLYNAFEAIVKDEEAFRTQLRQYAKMVDGRPQVTPSQIPPLVSQHLGWLKPSANNKMFNATLVLRRSPGSLVIPTCYPTETSACAANYDAMLPLMKAASELVTLPVDGSQSYSAYVGTVSQSDFSRALCALRWTTKGYYAPDIQYVIERESDITDWLVILPQLNDRKSHKDLPNVGMRSLFKRAIRDIDTGRWGEPTDPKHRPAAQMIVGVEPLFPPSHDIEKFKANNRGAVLIYPMSNDFDNIGASPKKDEVVIALAWILPPGPIGSPNQVLQFTVQNKAKANSPIVDAQS